MTTTNNTLNDEMMLAACKHYIRITEMSEKQLVAELFNLAEQYCANMPAEMFDYFERKKTSEEFIQDS